LFAGSTNTAKPAAASVAVNTNEEPAAVKLPVKNFTLAVELGRFYLHEVAITNFQTTVNLETSHVVVKPLQLSLNGAPVSASADVDLSVPGYKYDIAFDAQAVPLTPLLNTFVPARAGQMGGTVTASAQIKGAGFSGANLKKNLSGQFSFNATNLNLSMNNIKNPVLRLIVNAVCTLPEFLSNPVNAVTSLAGTATGQGGLTGNMEQSPIQSIAVQGTAGSGVVKLQPATMQSAVFKADTTGEIKLASVLNNSTVNLPVGLAVSQSVATQLSVSGTATNGYVALPQFLTITGTLGSPKADKKALVKNTIRAVGEKFLKGTNSPAANLMNQFFKSR
jgi:uncharacterized protein involved in outer membrane biogenesis